MSLLRLRRIFRGNFEDLLLLHLYIAGISRVGIFFVELDLQSRIGETRGWLNMGMEKDEVLSNREVAFDLATTR